MYIKHCSYIISTTKTIIQRHQISGQFKANKNKTAKFTPSIHDCRRVGEGPIWLAFSSFCICSSDGLPQDVPAAGGHHFYNPLEHFQPDSGTNSDQVLNVSYSKTIPKTVTQCNLTNCSTKCVSLLTVCHKCDINT